MDITLYKVKTDRGFFLVNAIDDVEARSLMEKHGEYVMPLKLKRMKLYHMSYFS